MHHQILKRFCIFSCTLNHSTQVVCLQTTPCKKCLWLQHRLSTLHSCPQTQTHAWTASAKLSSLMLPSLCEMWQSKEHDHRFQIQHNKWEVLKSQKRHSKIGFFLLKCDKVSWIFVTPATGAGSAFKCCTGFSLPGLYNVPLNSNKGKGQFICAVQVLTQ